MRLFIAILPDEASLGCICRARDALSKLCESGNFTRRENLHLTLAFLGDQPPSSISRVRSAMSEAAGESFDITFGGVGRFRRRGGDIWWLGADGGAELGALAGRLRGALEARGFKLEDRGFSPHLTLARQVVTAPEFKLAKVEAESEACVFRAERVHLMLSERVKGVLTYSPIISVPLGII